MTNKKIITISVIAGFLIAILARMSFFAFIVDFKNDKISYSIYTVAQRGDATNLGKAVVGAGGFPYSVYDDCAIRAHGMIVYTPTCERNSGVSEFAIVLNTIFWSLAALAFLLLVRVLGRLMVFKGLSLKE